MNFKYILPFYKKYVQVMSRLSALEMAFDFSLRSPIYIDEEDQGFNGQQHRKKIFLELLDRFDFCAILETGTFMGNTTGYMRQRAKCPILTCETSSMFQAVAMSRLKNMTGIEFVLADSRKFLKDKLSAPPLKNSPHSIFFYLDAHWHDDLPLKNEIEIITSSVQNAVIMIDDFEVPADDEYGYDNYGKGKKLDLKTFQTLFNKFDLAPFWPCLQGKDETGGKRGCVLLGHGQAVCKKLQSLKTIAQFGILNRNPN